MLSTRAAYISAHRRYLNFCHKFTLEHPYPLSEAWICRFAVFERLKHRTIQSGLGPGQPIHGQHATSRICSGGAKARRGTHRGQTKASAAEVLKRMAKADNRMLWAAACTGFFSFLRAGEFTVPSKQTYDPEVHLNLADMAIDSHEHPSQICLLIKQSKSWEGVEVFLGARGDTPCKGTGGLPGPLFVFESGSPLTRVALVAKLHEALQQVGLNHRDYNGHSFSYHYSGPERPRGHPHTDTGSLKKRSLQNIHQAAPLPTSSHIPNISILE